jgi:hypothetical protein
VEDEKAIEVIIRLEEEEQAASTSANHGIGRRLTVRTITTRSPGPARDDYDVSPMQRIETGAYRVVMEPEPAHVKPDGNALQREHIEATDYFFGALDQDSQQVTTDLESGNSRRKASVKP